MDLTEEDLIKKLSHTLEYPSFIDFICDTFQLHDHIAKEMIDEIKNKIINYEILLAINNHLLNCSTTKKTKGFSRNVSIINSEEKYELIMLLTSTCHWNCLLYIPEKVINLMKKHIVKTIVQTTLNEHKIKNNLIIKDNNIFYISFDNSNIFKYPKDLDKPYQKIKDVLEIMSNIIVMVESYYFINLELNG